MSSLANVYRVIDDTTNANATGGGTGGGSGQPLCPDFVAPTVQAAFNVAFIICTALQRSGRLVPLGSNPPYTLVQGQVANVAITSCPSGVTY